MKKLYIFITVIMLSLTFVGCSNDESQNSLSTVEETPVEDLLSEDINFFELRVNQNKLRVHGFQSHSAFFLVMLDRNHEAFPM